MSKKLLILLLIISTCLVALAACTSAGSGTSNPSGNTAATGNAVHMNDSQFVQTSVTIKKGDSVNLIDDSAAPHIIANGTWENGTPKPMQEAGAPKVDNVQISGKASQSIGPFNTAGTYHLYCTIHPDMNLTVTVQ